ncbi:DUF4880 domain-containing protein [Achromobacter xylosoxidans]
MALHAGAISTETRQAWMAWRARSPPTSTPGSAPSA